MDKFTFIPNVDKMTNNGKTIEMFNDVLLILSDFGSIVPYVEPTLPEFTNEQYLELEKSLENETERANTAEQELELYAPLITSYNVMTAADRKKIEVLTEENNAKIRVECGLTQIEQIVESLRKDKLVTITQNI